MVKKTFFTYILTYAMVCLSYDECRGHTTAPTATPPAGMSRGRCRCRQLPDESIYPSAPVPVRRPISSLANSHIIQGSEDKEGRGELCIHSYEIEEQTASHKALKKTSKEACL